MTNRKRKKIIKLAVVVAAVLSVIILSLSFFGRSLFSGGVGTLPTGKVPNLPEGAFCVMCCNIAHG